MTEREFPAHVIEALETLERASAPGSLGPAYQALLEWRRKAPRSAPRANINLRDLLAGAVWVACIAATYFFVQWILSAASDEFLHGFSTAAVIGGALLFLSSILRRTPDPASTVPSIDSRIDAAINRWRHLVPVMKELPR